MENEVNIGLIDKRSLLQVIGGLLQDHTLVDSIDLQLDRRDFYAGKEKLYEIIYVSIYNLYMQGVQKIDEYAIDSYLMNYKEQYKIFTENNGLQYLIDARDIADLKNYEYYYRRLRKLSLLRYYENKGLDTRFIFDTTLIESKAAENEQIKFDNFTEQEIVDLVENDFVISPKISYCTNSLTTDSQAGGNLEELVEELCETPDVGVPLTSVGLNTVSRGQRLGKFFLRSGTTGSSKSRQAIMDACTTSVPYQWDLEKKEWKYTGFDYPALFISTEMSVDECQTIILATVAGVSEEHILYGEYKEGERERIATAIQYIEASPLYISVITDFSISDIENLCKKYHTQYSVNYVYFDYIFVTPRLVEEMTKNSKMHLQEYQLLTMFSTRLKALAEQLHIFIMSSTQLNGEASDMKYKDSRALQGSKAVANKIDFGVISMKPTAAELKKIEAITHKMINCPEVNMMHWVYKCRRGRLTRIIIFSHINLGCMREKTLFVTDYDFNLIDVDFTKIESMDKVVDENSHVMTHKDFEEEVVQQELEEVETTPKFNW